MSLSTHYWTPGELQDLLALPRDEFLEKYEHIGYDAWRIKHGRHKRAVETSAPIVLEDDGLYRPTAWDYSPQSPSRPTLERHVMIGDTHGYYVEQEVWKTVLDFVRDFKPHRIHLLGDIIDFYDISRYLKDPNRRLVLGKEVEFTRDAILKPLRDAAPQATIEWTEGNHEARLNKYLWSRAPELASLPGLDIRNIFSLDDLRIHYKTKETEVGGVVMTHGHIVRAHSGWTAKAMMEGYGQSVIHNHTHRLGAVYSSRRGSDWVGFENGCLCQMDPSYITGTPNWQHGFSVGWLRTDGTFNFSQVHIKNGGFVYEGKFFGRDERLDHCHD
jgi:hypothetical protein